MKMMLRLLLIIPSLVICAQSVAAEQIGTVLSTNGNVYAKNTEGTQRTLKRRSAIFLKDTIAAQSDSRAQIRLKDNTLLSIHPNTTFTIEAFQYKKGAPQNKLLGKLVVGTLVSLSTQGESKNYQLQGPMSTIGLRGTGVVFKVTPLKEDVGVFEGSINVKSTGSDKDISNLGNHYQAVEVIPSGTIQPSKESLLQPIPLTTGMYYKITAERLEALRSIRP